MRLTLPSNHHSTIERKLDKLWRKTSSQAKQFSFYFFCPENGVPVLRFWESLQNQKKHRVLK